MQSTGQPRAASLGAHRQWDADASSQAVIAFAKIRWRTAPGAPDLSQSSFSALRIVEDAAAGNTVVPDLVVGSNAGLSSAAGGKFKGLDEVPSAPCHAVQLAHEETFAATGGAAATDAPAATEQRTSERSRYSFKGLQKTIEEQLEDEGYDSETTSGTEGEEEEDEQ
jgi:hypothetical protein